MDYSLYEHLTRRKFIRGVAGATACCACFPWGHATAAEENAESTGEEEDDAKPGNVHLAAVCGTYCGACPAYLAKHGEEKPAKEEPEKTASGPARASKGIPDPNWMEGLLCDGCLSNGQIAPHCRTCAMKRCAASKPDVTRCSDCKELPCARIQNLINTGLLHRAEYLPNLAKIREMGVSKWLEKEEERWRCPKCRRPMSWYDAKCSGCGEPRSKDLFPLS